MPRTITFNELRRFKDKLPNGSIRKIAEELDMEVETVRNYFGGYNYEKGKSIGVHIEPGPDGGIVVLNDTTIFDKALAILGLDDYPSPKEIEQEEIEEEKEVE